MKIKPKIMTVFGTRPEAIKMCPLVLELNSSPFFESVLCVSGQHEQMLDSVLDHFKICPNFNLEIMKDCHCISDITARILDRLTPILKYQAPDMVIVHGDTSTAHAAALAAFYEGIPVAHVEAGLRSFDLASPFPEEYNRVAVDTLSTLCFAPTRQAEKNLLSEGKAKDKIFVTGNTVIDSLLLSVKKDYRNPLLSTLLPNEKSMFAILTLHRRENIGEPMKSIFRAVRKVLEERTELSVLFPVHKNPAVRELAKEYLSDSPRLFICEPMDAPDFQNMLARCDFILTDSGGIQEEAAFLGKPTLILRDATERIEAGESLKLIGTDEERVYKEVSDLLKDKRIIQRMSRPSYAFGKGDATKKIVSILYRYFFD